MRSELAPFLILLIQSGALATRAQDGRLIALKKATFQIQSEEGATDTIKLEERSILPPEDYSPKSTHCHRLIEKYNTNSVAESNRQAHEACL